MRPPLSAIALLLAAAVLVGCGGGGDATSSSSSTPAPAASKPNTAPPSLEHHDSGGGAAQFEAKGSDNSIQESGTEASGSDREEAAAALHGYLDAGARGDSQGACRYFSKPAYEQIAATAGAKGEPCPRFFTALFKSVAAEDFAKAARADIGSLRLAGDSGYLLYHGAEGIDYAMPMVVEGSEWKVAALGGSPLL